MPRSMQSRKRGWVAFFALIFAAGLLCGACMTATVLGACEAREVCRR